MIKKALIITFIFTSSVAISVGFSGGSGTQSDPYEVSSCSSLPISDGSQYYELTTDLDCSNSSAIFGVITDLTGTFYGRNKSISGLKDDYFVSDKISSSGSIQNIEIKNSYFEADTGYLVNREWGAVDQIKTVHNVQFRDITYLDNGGSSYGGLVAPTGAYTRNEFEDISINDIDIDSDSCSTNGAIGVVAEGDISDATFDNIVVDNIDASDTSCNIEAYEGNDISSPFDVYYNTNDFTDDDNDGTGLTDSNMEQSSSYSFNIGLGHIWKINDGRVNDGKPFLTDITSESNPAPVQEYISLQDGDVIEPNKSIKVRFSDDENSGSVNIVNASSGNTYKNVNYQFGTNKTIQTDDIDLFNKGGESYEFRVDAVDSGGYVVTNSPNVTTINNVKPDVNEYNITPDTVKEGDSLSASANITDENGGQTIDVSLDVYADNDTSSSYETTVKQDISLTDSNDDNIYEANDFLTVEPSIDYRFNLTADDGIDTTKNSTDRYVASKYPSGNVTDDGFEDGDLNELPEWNTTENSVNVDVKQVQNVLFGDYYGRFSEKFSNGGSTYFGSISKSFNNIVDSDISYGVTIEQPDEIGDEIKYKVTGIGGDSSQKIWDITLKDAGSNRHFESSNIDICSFDPDTAYRLAMLWDEDNNKMTRRVVNLDNNEICGQLTTDYGELSNSFNLYKIEETSLTHLDTDADQSVVYFDNMTFEGSRTDLDTEFFWNSDNNQLITNESYEKQFNYTVQSEEGAVDLYYDGVSISQDQKERGNATFIENKNIAFGNHTYFLQYTSSETNNINQSKNKWIYLQRPTDMNIQKPNDGKTFVGTPEQKEVTIENKINASDGQLRLYLNNNNVENFTHTAGENTYSYTTNFLGTGNYSFYYEFERDNDGVINTTDTRTFEVEKKANIDILEPIDGNNYGIDNSERELKAEVDGADGSVYFFSNNNLVKEYNKSNFGSATFNTSETYSGGQNEFKVIFDVGTRNATDSVTFQIEEELQEEFSVEQPKNNFTYDNVGDKRFLWNFTANSGDSTIYIDNDPVYTFSYGGGFQSFDLKFNVDTVGSHTWKHSHKLSNGNVINSSTYNFYVENTSTSDSEFDTIENEYDDYYENRTYDRDELEDEIKQNENTTDETTKKIVDEIVNTTGRIDESLIGDTDGTESIDGSVDRFYEEYESSISSGEIDSQSDLEQTLERRNNIPDERAEQIANDVYDRATISSDDLPDWLVDIINLEFWMFALLGLIFGYTSGGKSRYV